MTARRIFIGWTGENALAAQVCEYSLLKHASVPLDIRHLRHWELRTIGLYRRPFAVTVDGQRLDLIDGTPFSTDFSFTRFLAPALANFADEWVLYCDSDMLWLDDVASLFAEVDGANQSVACVQHPGGGSKIGPGRRKITGSVQSPYWRKYWSSLMLMHAERCAELTPDYVNRASGADLHQFKWAPEPIKALPIRWNVLHGLQKIEDPAVVHFTLGTPDLPLAAPADEWSESWWDTARKLEIKRVACNLCNL
jgi:hypothetical protein